MPTRERVQAFVAMVEAGDYVEAIRQFYTDDATMQENLGTMRTGRDALAAHEEAALKSVRSITTRPGSTYAIDGDRVIVHWVFDIVQADGKQVHARRARLPDLARRPHRAGAVLLRSGTAQAGVAIRQRERKQTADDRASAPGMIEIEFASGTQVRITVPSKPRRCLLRLRLRLGQAAPMIPVRRYASGPNTPSAKGERPS